MSKSILKKVVEKISPQKRKFVKRQGEIAVRIAEILKASGMTQRELAEKLGKKESYISRVLAGWTNPTLKSIVEFEVALGADLIEIPTNDLKRNASTYTVTNIEEPEKIGSGVI